MSARSNGPKADDPGMPALEIVERHRQVACARERGYVHVGDLASAHVVKRGRAEAFNLCNGSGYSVAEVLRAVEVVGVPIPVHCEGRHPGDTAVREEGKI
jgi:nucleoside-diphosphate-sugar epimerase